MSNSMLINEIQITHLAALPKKSSQSDMGIAKSPSQTCWVRLLPMASARGMLKRNPWSRCKHLPSI